MNILSWLFGKKKADVPTAPNSDFTAAEVAERTAPPIPDRRSVLDREGDNLRRWRESGRPRAWVEARQGSWNHEDWLALLEELKGSSYWPMQPDAVGLTLEDAKREWLQRN